MTPAAGPGFRMLLWVYDLLMELAVWLLLVPLHRLRQGLGRHGPDVLAQRLGRAPLPAARGRPRILLHAVSVGETAAAAPIGAELARLLPQACILVSSGNGDGAKAAQVLAAPQPHWEAIGLLPWDRRRALDAWLGRLAPDLVVVMETELWPNLFWGCQRLGIPLALANGRVYPEDLAGYRLLRPLMGPVLACLDWVGAQDGAEAQRLAAIGMPWERIQVTGNSKLDRVEARLGPPADLGPGPLIVAGSTHPPEERWLLDALEQLARDGLEPRLLLAPRQPRRAGRLAAAARRRGRCPVLWSEWQGDPDWDLLILDRIGPLGACYGAADLVFLGGSLVRRGGHNPAEPAAWGRPILVGPHTEHFQSMMAGLETVGGLVRVSHQHQLAPLFSALLADAGRRQALGQVARHWLLDQDGAAARQALALADLLRAPLATPSKK